MDISSAETHEEHNDLHAIDDASTIDESTIDSNIDGSDQKQLEKERERKRRQKRARFVGYVRSRKLKRKMKNSLANEQVLNPASVGLLNSDDAIPKALPYKKYRSEILEIMSQNAILEHRTRVNRRAAQPFNYSVDITQPPKKNFKAQIPVSGVKKESMAIKCEQVEVASKEKTNPSKSVSGGAAGASDNNNMKPRSKRRINYSEELVDEAFMYEQMLHDKQKQQEKTKKTTNKKCNQVLMADGPIISSGTISSAGNLDSRIRMLEQNNEISITPLVPRLVANEKKTPIPTKTEPLFNITSSVSVHIKPRTKEPSGSNLRISNITSLHNNRDTPPSKKRKISCKYCEQAFANETQLASHQVVHLIVSAYKLDSTKILHPKLRRVSSNKNRNISNDLLSENVCVSLKKLQFHFRVAC